MTSPQQPQALETNRIDNSGTPMTPTSQLGFVPQPSPWHQRIQAAKKAYSRIGAAVTLILVVWLGLAWLLQQLVSSVLLTPTSASLSLVISECTLLIAIAIGYIVLRSEPLIPTEHFSMKLSQFFIFLLISVPILYAGTFLGNGIARILANSSPKENRVESTIIGVGNNPLLIIAVIVILAPIIEEWLFRKQIIGRLRVFGEKPAILMSALMFGLYHMNLYQFFYAFGLGLIFGYIYMRTSQLKYSIILHIIINFNGSVVSVWVMGAMSSLGIADNSNIDIETLTSSQMASLLVVALYSLVMIAALITGIVLLIMRWKRREFYITPQQLPQGTVVKTIFGNAGIIIFMVVGVLLTVMSVFTVI